MGELTKQYVRGRGCVATKLVACAVGFSEKAARTGDPAIHDELEDFQTSDNQMRRIERISGSSRPIKCWQSHAGPFDRILYCPGRLGACEKVLIDIGTGYYVRKTRDEAREFFDRKLEMVHANV